MASSETMPPPEPNTNRLVLWLVGLLVVLCIVSAGMLAVSYSLYAAERSERRAADRVAIETRRRFECAYQNSVHDSLQGLVDLVTTPTATDGLDPARRAIVEQANAERSGFKALSAPLIDRLACPAR